MKLLEKIKYLILVILFFTAIPVELYSQSYFVHNYSIESGLPTSNILDVTQDFKGRMWFATALGISVYDGYQWENIDSKKGLPSSKYRRIKTDEKGIIWCIPHYVCESLVYFVDDSMKTVNSPEVNRKNSSLFVTSFDLFYENEEPVLCVGSTNGVYIFKKGTWTNFNSNNGLSANLVHDVTAYKNKFYVSTQKGASVLDGVNIDNSINEVFDHKNPEILAISFDINDTVNGECKMWVLGRSWLGWLQNNELKILNDDFILPIGIEFQNPSLVPAKNNIIYFGNFYYSFCINKINGELYPLTNKQGFRCDGSTSIFIDKEENVWQTGSRGVDKLSNLYLVNYYLHNGLLENEVSSILEYEKDKFIIGHNMGVSILNKDKFSWINFPLSELGYPGESRVLDITKGNDGSIWLACAFAGLGKLEKDGSIKWIKFNYENYVSSVSIDKYGVVWVTSNDGVYIVKNGRFEEPEDLKLAKKFYRRIFFSGNGESFLASLEGLIWKTKNNIKYLSVKDNEQANNVYSVFKDNKNNVFIGTRDGLYILKNDSYEKYYNVDNGIKIDIAVYSILQDDSGNYWFGTDDGVIKWNGKDNKRIVFTKGNGLSGREINRAALIKDSKGNIWIGTESGLTCYRPAFDNKNIPVPKILLLNAEDPEGNKYPLTQKVELKSKYSTLNFVFRGISFYNENYIQYKIKLEGFDADWYEINQSQIDKIRYTNLIPGDYKLLVTAKNTSGEWSDVAESSVITIEKPFYQKWWFYVLMILVFLILLYVIYRIYIVRLYFVKLEKQVNERTAELRETEKALRKSQSELEEKVIERTSELANVNEQLKEINASKDKFFSIIAHDMKSPFTGLLGYSEILKNEAAMMDKKTIIEYTENLHKNLKNTYNLLENLLNWSLFQTGRMEFYPEQVDVYLLVQGIIDVLKVNSGAKNIEIKNHVAINTSVQGDKNMLRTVIYNLVSNAVKFTNRGGLVVVSSENINGFVQIAVTDNGVGIPKDIIDVLFKLASNVSTKGTEMEKGTGLGLLLCKEIIEKHNGKIFVESELGKGTTFKIQLTSE